MPLRPFCREQAWLLPPSLEEMVPADHPARVVAAFVDALDATAWAELAIEVQGDRLGAPAYHPRALLSVWVYGFMSGVRSARKLEAACQDQLAYLWLTGCQRPDHNTLWRFYKANRKPMRKLLKCTVRMAVSLGLVDLALQAVDGSKIQGNAARDRTLGAEGLERLLKRTAEAIEQLEAQNEGGGEPTMPRLPRALVKAEALREQVRAALEQVKDADGPAYVNLTDGDTRLVKGRQGLIAGYNTQAVVSPLVAEVAQGTGLLITASDVVNEADDHAQLVPILAEAEATTGQRAAVSLADGGYHSGANLAACQEGGYRVLMPESQERALEGAYHKDRFQYDGEKDSYTCPAGQELAFSGVKHRQGRPETRVYRASAAVCCACPAFGRCTKDKHQGRAVEVGPHEGLLRQHRTLMETEEAKAVYGRRKELVEPVFGILKEMHGARRFLLRGLENVKAEWALLATAFNLRTLYGVWRRWQRLGRTVPLAPTRVALA
jgi:transposase